MGGLNLRSEPDLGASIITVIPDGEKVDLLEERGAQFELADVAGTWSRIKWDGYEGWVFGGFLSDRSSPTAELSFAGEYGPVFAGSGLYLYVSKDDQYLYIMSTGTSTLFWFQRNSSTGEAVMAGEYTHPDLRGAHLLFSEDNTYIYGVTGSKISCFRRNVHTGAVTFAETLSGNFSGYAEDTVIAPDGRHIYSMIRKEGHHSIACLSRDRNSGKLTPAFTYHKENQEFTSGLAMSPDGRHVYTSEDRVNIIYFNRNPETGELKPAGTCSVEPSEGYLNAPRIVLSPDGTCMFGTANIGYSIGQSGTYSFWLDRNQDTGSLHLRSSGETSSYRPAFFSFDGSLFFGGAWDGLKVYKRDAATGEYIFTKASGAGDTVVSGAVSGDGRYVYMIDGNRLVWYACNSNTGDIAQSGVFKDTNELDQPWGLVLSPDNMHVYVLSYKNSSIAAFSRDEKGLLTYIDSYTTAGLFHPGEIVLSPDGNYIYTDSFARYAGFYLFRRNKSTGTLWFEKYYANPFGYGSKELIISPDGNYLFALTDTEIGWYHINRETGRLYDFKTYGNDAIIKAGAMAMSPDNKHLYVFNSPDAGGHAILWFSWNALKAELAYQGRYENPELAYGKSIAISPDGRDVYTAGRALFRFKRDPVSGDLGLRDTFLEDSTIGTAIQISPEGGSLYICEGQSLATFKRYANTGELLYINSFEDDTMLSWIIDFAISPDGRNLYLLDASQDKVFYFHRMCPF